MEKRWSGSRRVKAEEGKRAEKEKREREGGKKEVAFQLIRLRVNASSCR